MNRLPNAIKLGKSEDMRFEQVPFDPFIKVVRVSLKEEEQEYGNQK